MQDPHSQKLVASRAKKNKQTQLYELLDYDEKINDLIKLEKEMIKKGNYCKGRVDPVSVCFGPEHGGRTRIVSDIIGSTHVHGGLYKSARVVRRWNVNKEKKEWNRAK
ncbi:hypothetical protein E3N88_32722 [Mikania micrantha]|uniref:Uncharacterized protein n=1 Tax=Mikania micrantha TaxID=192012 RepID=A0A5N6M9T3_9ASTR|nr:hypothetical protein E3N88_32722 [Mikania micrantha]